MGNQLSFNKPQEAEILAAGGVWFVYINRILSTSYIVLFQRKKQWFPLPGYMHGALRGPVV